MRLRRILIALTSVVLLASPAVALQPPAGQSEFVPVNSLPSAADQLPAAPLLIAAYAFVWLAVMVYVWTIWRRLNKVEDEMRTLAQKTRG
jgi:CcmD family protein